MTHHEVPAELLQMDMDGVIRQASAGVSELLGLGKGRLSGRRSETLPLALVSLLQEVRATPEEPITRELQLGRPSRRILATASLVLDASEPMFAVVLAPREKASQEFQNTLDAVISGFAHEVRNPLAAILSITEAALSQLDSTLTAARMVERIPGLVNRIDKLLKQSQSYGRPRPPLRTTTDVKQMVGWVMELAQARHHGVEIRVDLASDLAPVLVDAEQIEQVLVNLLCNAQDAARSWVSLTASQREGNVVLEVSDDGPGIQDQHRARIFEPFYTMKANGTGLGLAIARNLARLNGGELSLEKTSSRGTLFRLCLEACTAPAASTKAA